MKLHRCTIFSTALIILSFVIAVNCFFKAASFRAINLDIAAAVYGATTKTFNVETKQVIDLHNFALKTRSDLAHLYFLFFGFSLLMATFWIFTAVHLYQLHKRQAEQDAAANT